MSRKTSRAENNDHIIKFCADFPHLSNTQIAAKIGTSDTSISSWRNNKLAAPFWTTNAFEWLRKELEVKHAVQSRPDVVEVKDAVQEKEGNQLFLVEVPVARAVQFKGVVAMFGGNVVEM